MSHNNSIEKYFTPVTARSVKRPRPYSSPENTDGSLSAMDSMDKVGELSRKQLLEDLNALLDSKMSRLATKDDLVSISTEVAAVLEENKRLKEEVRLLQKSEKAIMNKLVDLESRSRRNNLVFRGLKCAGVNPDYREIVRKFCVEMFGCAERTWVNRAHPLGPDRKAIIAHLPDDTDIEFIMSKVGKLKGTGYVVDRDFPKEIRDKRSRLSALRAEVQRVAGWRKMPLNFDHLDINGTRFTWREDRLWAGPMDGVNKLSEMFKHDFTEFVAKLTDKSTDEEDAASGSKQVTAPGNVWCQTGGVTAMDQGTTASQRGGGDTAPGEGRSTTGAGSGRQGD